MPDSDELAQKMMRIILRGQVDEHLDSVVDALSRRRKYLRDRQALEMVATLEIGDRVSISSGIKPKYLENQRGVIIPTPSGQNDKQFTLWVQLDYGVGKFRSGRIRMPASCLRLIYKKPALAPAPPTPSTSSSMTISTSDVALLKLGEEIGTFLNENG